MNLLTFALLAAAAAGDLAAVPPEDLVLAEVDGEPITVARLVEEFRARHGGHLSLLVGEDVIRSFLDQQVEDRLLVLEATRMELHRDPRVVEGMRRLERRLRTEALLREEVSGPVEISDGEVAAAREALREVHHIRWIRVPTRAMAEAAAARVRAGETFEDVAREVSTDPSSRHGGDPGPFAWGGADEELERAVLRLAPGAMSDVFPVGDDFGLVLLVERLELEEPPSGRSAEQKIQRVLHARKEAGRLRALTEALMRDAGATIDDAALSLENLRRAARGEGEDAVVARVGEREVFLFQLAGNLDFESWSAMPGERFTRQVRRAVERLLGEMLQEEEARRRGAGGEELELALRVAEDRAILRILLAEYLYGGLKATPAELEAFHRDHRERFREPARYHVRHLIVPEREQADSLRAELEAGDEEAFAAAAERWSLDGGTAPYGGDAGWLGTDRISADMRAILEALPPGALSPVIETSGGFLLVRMVEVRPARDRAFAEVQEDVRAAWLDDAKRAARERWLRRLREVSDVRVDEDAIRRAARQMAERARDRYARDGAAMPHGGGH